MQETIARFGALAKLAEQKHQELMEECYGFGDAIAGLDVNPGGSFTSMRQWHWRLSSRFTDYICGSKPNTVRITTSARPCNAKGARGARC